MNSDKNDDAQPGDAVQDPSQHRSPPLYLAPANILTLRLNAIVPSFFISPSIKVLLNNLDLIILHHYVIQEAKYDSDISHSLLVQDIISPLVGSGL